MSWEDRVIDLAGKDIRIFRQGYGGQPRIHDSVIITLGRVFPDPDHGGSIRELARFEGAIHTELANAGFKLPVKQINVTVVEPDAAVGLHIHPDQREAWFVIPGFGRLTAFLIDLRSDSPTHGALNKVVMGYGDTVLGIPEGILHGYWNPTKEPAILIYLTSHHFTHDDKSTDFQEGRVEPSDLPEELASQLPEGMRP